jgi:bacillithiol system protein YtxJ
MVLMKWIPLTSEDQLIEIRERSATLPQVIFKHSTRCGTSSMVLNRLERADAPESVDFYFLDLISHRNLSNKIAEEFSVYHESPQVLLIKNGECVYDESHMGIQMDELVEQVLIKN